MAAQRSKAEKARQPASLYRKLPALERVLERREIATLANERGFDRAFLKAAVTRFLDDLRQGISDERIGEQQLDARLADLVTGVTETAEAMLAFHLRPVVNATGVIVHTNLGRSPWSSAAAERAGALAQRYTNLEFDLDQGSRGRREKAVARMVGQLLPGAETVVVNNNAAAVLLVLNTLAAGKEVVVSRGQLVEIGGSFRIPEVMGKAAAVLHEVGTTNRTRLADYEAAIGPETGALMSVHPSNYRVVGFTESVALDDLVELGARHGVPVVEDMGSGNLLDLSPWGIDGEPRVADRLASGVDLVTFSGDKLLGGPQAGFVVGKADYVRRCRDNPLYRALRLDKVITVALEATLAAYVSGHPERLPAVRMLATSAAELKPRADALAARVRSELADRFAAVEVIEASSRVGGGAAPGRDLLSYAVVLSPHDRVDHLAARLRRADPAVIGRIAEDRLLLDVRTLLDGDEDRILAALEQAVRDA